MEILALMCFALFVVMVFCHDQACKERDHYYYLSELYKNEKEKWKIIAKGGDPYDRLRKLEAEINIKRMEINRREEKRRDQKEQGWLLCYLKKWTKVIEEAKDKEDS